MQCEEAKAHLIECCRPLVSEIDCEYHPPACGGGAVYPDLSAGEGKGIRALTCSEIITGGYCELTYKDSASEDLPSSLRGTLC